MGPDLVVPTRPVGVRVQVQRVHLRVTDADPLSVLAGDPVGRHLQAGEGSGSVLAGDLPLPDECEHFIELGIERLDVLA